MSSIVSLLAVLALLPRICLGQNSPHEAVLKSLGGHEAVAVQVELQEELDRLGLTSDVLQVDVELRLRSVGIPVMPYDGAVAILRVEALVLPLTDQAVVLYTVRLRLLWGVLPLVGPGHSNDQCIEPPATS